MALSKRKLKSMATKERIRNVALQLMRTHSIDEISVQDICTQADVGIGTFYHYYKTKDDIVYGVYNEMDAHFLKLAEEAEAEDIPPYEFILRHFVCYTRFITETTVDFAKKVYSLQSKMFLDKERPFYSTLQGYLGKKQKEGAISTTMNIDEFCTFVNISLRGIAYDWCVHDGSYDLTQSALNYAGHILAKYQQDLHIKSF